MDNQSDKISQLEDRIEQLEATTKKMMPTRRDALKFGGAAAIGAAAMSGTASAGSSQVGTIGDASNLVDVEAEDIDVSDTLTTQDIVVNGTATGPFGGGGIVLEAGDTITVAVIDEETNDSDSFVDLYNGSAKDLLGGTIAGGPKTQFKYTFSDSSTLDKENFSGFDQAESADRDGTKYEVSFLPPAKSITRIQVTNNQILSTSLGATAIFKD